MRCNKTQRGTSLVTVRVPLSRETTRHMTVGREPKRLCSVEDDFRIMRLLSSSSIRGTVQRADFTSREIKVPVRAAEGFVRKPLHHFTDVRLQVEKPAAPSLKTHLVATVMLALEKDELKIPFCELTSQATPQHYISTPVACRGTAL